MTAKSLLRPTNRQIRLIVGLGILALVCTQCVNRTEAVHEDDLFTDADGNTVGGEAGSLAERVDELANNDQIALLKLCLGNYDGTIRDYTCTLIKQEQINGEKGAPQEIKVKFLDHPFSVAMQWVKNAPIGDRCLYVEGKNDGNMLIRPKGLLSLIGTVKRKPDSEAVMANTLRPINLFGFRRGLRSLLRVYELADSRGDLTVTCTGHENVDGRRTVVLQRILPVRDDYPAEKTLIYIDTERLLPVCIKAWNWDGTFQSQYIYSDVRLNTGLTSDDFAPEKNGL